MKHPVLTGCFIFLKRINYLLLHFIGFIPHIRSAIFFLWPGCHSSSFTYFVFFHTHIRCAIFFHSRGFHAIFLPAVLAHLVLGQVVLSGRPRGLRRRTDSGEGRNCSNASGNENSFFHRKLLLGIIPRATSLKMDSSEGDACPPN